MTYKLTVVERSDTEIDPLYWAMLSARREFWHLVSTGVVEVRQVGPRRVSIRGTAHVGVARIGEVTLEIHEKVAGALSALLPFAAGDSFRIETVPAPGSELGKLFSLLVDCFLGAVRAYASRGRDFEYRRVSGSSSFVRGTLDVTRTIGLKARGLGHLVAYSHDELSYATLKNRVVLAALRSLEAMPPEISLSAPQLARARGLAMMFADCRDIDVIAQPASYFATAAASMLETSSDRDSDLLTLASIVLSRISFEHGAADFTSVPRAWFVSLERLFELAARRVLGKILGEGKVQRGLAERRNVLGFIRDNYRADPDLVIRTDRMTAIGDVKYKAWSPNPKAADVYQLIAHAAAFGASTAFLVYPDTTYRFRHAGVAATACTVIFLCVNIRDLEADLTRACHDLGLVGDSAAGPPSLSVKGLPALA